MEKLYKWKGNSDIDLKIRKMYTESLTIEEIRRVFKEIKYELEYEESLLNNHKESQSWELQDGEDEE